MIGRVVLGGVALAAAGYGLAKYFEDKCDCTSYTNTKTDTDTKPTDIKDEWMEYSENAGAYELAGLYELEYKVYNNTFKKYQELIAKVQNLDLDKKDPITLDETIPTSYEHTKQISDIASRVFDVLHDCEIKLEDSLEKLETIVTVSLDYESYTKEVKQNFSDTLVVADLIYDILTTKIIEDDKPSKSILEQIEQFEKALQSVDKD